MASLDTLLSQEALNKLRPQNQPPSHNREMFAQGIGNLSAGLLGTMPITAVIVRSSVNVSTGAQTKLSILIHGVLLLICGLWFSVCSTPFRWPAWPQCCFTPAISWPPRLFVEQFRMEAQQYVSFLATIGGIIVFGMLAGIGIVLVTQMLFSLYKKSHRNALQLTRYDDHYVLRFQQNLTFYA